MLHPDARISATMQVKIQSHPRERWTVSCSALNKRDGRSFTSLRSINSFQSRHFGPLSGRFPAIRPINQLRNRQEPAAVWHPGKDDGHVRSRDDGGPNRVLLDQSGVNLSAWRIVKLSPALLIWRFGETCTIRRSGRLVSACQRTTHPRTAFRLERADLSLTPN